ncbi:hypothetical protein MKC54_02705 [[Clostridium] innocuum]|nr:hypothetical protein [[Clostridium] innocuum]MCR0575785.1 hypothetical protein [[Clostridium] innocuum]
MKHTACQHVRKGFSIDAILLCIDAISSSYHCHTNAPYALPLTYQTR